MRPLGCDAHVVVVGGGFSGTLVAVNLLRHGGPRVSLIERGSAAGAGTAYSTREAAHLLNVRAANMSAFPDAPEHFAAWLGGSPASFASRGTYGAYLRELLAAARGLRVVEGEAVAARRGVVELASGERLAADAVVLATGNFAPHAPPGIDPDALPADAYVDDPWRADVAAGLAASDDVLLLGTGLTAVDVALTLEAAGFGGRVHALSRRGLTPRVHAEVTPPPPLPDWPAPDPLALLAQVRRDAAAMGWRAAVDRLRPVTQRLWRTASDRQRQQFLRHLRPWWDVHRHRLAPAVAESIGRLTRDGRFVVQAGTLLGAERDGRGVRVHYRPRGEATAATIGVRRVINCTGPGGDVARADDPLLRRLIADGFARPDRLRLGIDVDAQLRVLSARGDPQPWLRAVGPLTRGAFWEITAVPDIRRQVWDLARELANARWEGGEGL